jgi:hypothetical protein
LEGRGEFWEKWKGRRLKGLFFFITQNLYWRVYMNFSNLIYVVIIFLKLKILLIIIIYLSFSIEIRSQKM